MEEVDPEDLNSLAVHYLMVLMEVQEVELAAVVILEVLEMCLL